MKITKIITTPLKIALSCVALLSAVAWYGGGFPYVKSFFGVAQKTAQEASAGLCSKIDEAQANGGGLFTASGNTMENTPASGKTMAISPASLFFYKVLDNTIDLWISPFGVCVGTLLGVGYLLKDVLLAKASAR
jgi:hypothetical protein